MMCQTIIPQFKSHGNYDVSIDYATLHNMCSFKFHDVSGDNSAT